MVSSIRVSGEMLAVMEGRWFRGLYVTNLVAYNVFVSMFAILGVECSTEVIANVLVWTRSVRYAHTAHAIKLGQYLTDVIANV